MTTTVKVLAHLASTKEVKVTITDNDQPVGEFTLQDGEAIERSVYDGLKICVKEVEK